MKTGENRIMKHNLLGASLAVLLLARALSAQNSYPKVSSGGNDYNHAEVGAFFNYTRLHNANDTNFYGLGGRIGVNVGRNVALEAEGAYDFSRDLTVSVGSGGSFSNTTSNLRIAHFMFGPKFQWGSSGPVRVFVTAKGGLINFSTDTNFGSQVVNIPNSATDAVFYPGAGIELFARWLGVRFEAGDEMYFDHGTNHNLRLTAGPVIRF
jgi:opacity protein-like surface antigen